MLSASYFDAKAEFVKDPTDLAIPEWKQTSKTVDLLENMFLFFSNALNAKITLFLCYFLAPCRPPRIQIRSRPIEQSLDPTVPWPGFFVFSQWYSWVRKSSLQICMNVKLNDFPHWWIFAVTLASKYPGMELVVTQGLNHWTRYLSFVMYIIHIVENK